MMIPLQVQTAYDAINEARRLVMELYEGNLDHPALDDLEAAMAALFEAELQVQAWQGAGVVGATGSSTDF